MPSYKCLFYKYPFNKQSSFLLLLCLLLFCAPALTSCKGIEITGKTENVEEYSFPEVMVVLASERNRYQKVFGEALWDMPIEGQQEGSYGDYFIARMKEFFQNLKTLNLMAEDRGIVVSSVEMDTIRTVAVAFYEGLSEEDKALMGGCSIMDVTNMYVEYYLASKMAEVLLSDVDAEISDAAAKVIEVEQIVSDDWEEITALYQSVQAEGANFSYYARQNAKGEAFERSLSRADAGAGDLYYDTAFSLEKGQISEIFEADGRWYILKCVNGYDEAATLDRKARLETAIRTAAFQDGFQGFAKQHIVRFRAAYWKEIDLHSHPESTVSNFFSLFDENVSLG